MISFKFGVFLNTACLNAECIHCPELLKTDIMNQAVAAT